MEELESESNWKQEYKGYTSNKFEWKLLEDGAKSYMQGIYLGSLYSRWRRIKGLDKHDPKENIGQMQSSFKEFERILNEKMGS